MNQAISIYLPLRSGSTRVIHKNTRPFTPDGRSLLQFKLDELVKILDHVGELVVSTNDPLVLEQVAPYTSDSRIKIDHRPDHLCTSTTKVQDLINYVPSVVSGQHVFWLHVTAPFFTAQDYLTALDEYQAQVINGEYDSIMSVNKLQQFIWDDNQKKIINCDRSVNPWPNTQDLAPLYEINHAFYINSVENYKAFQDRIGRNPCLFITEGEKCIDIDWEADFKLAQNMLVSLMMQTQ